jgi:hypothetical protein
MFGKFFADADAAERFADAVPADRFSPAQVQERLLKAANPDDAIALFREQPADVALLRAA